MPNCVCFHLHNRWRWFSEKRYDWQDTCVLVPRIVCFWWVAIERHGTSNVRHHSGQQRSSIDYWSPYWLFGWLTGWLMDWLI